MTDCRFIRDIAAVKAVGGIIIQVHRNEAGLTGAAALHRGEVERNSPEFQALVDHHIYNDGTLDELRVKTRNLVALLQPPGANPTVITKAMPEHTWILTQAEPGTYWFVAHEIDLANKTFVCCSKCPKQAKPVHAFVVAGNAPDWVKVKYATLKDPPNIPVTGLPTSLGNCLTSNPPKE